MEIYAMFRAQEDAILQDLRKKMVIIVGPRQAGKTWLAKRIGKSFEPLVYLNYDQAEDQQIMRAQNWPESTECIILDELHKMSQWKNYLKGLYDTKPEKLKIIVTGSARMDIFRQVGDSLAGRYFLHHLLPLSLAELRRLDLKTDLDHLISRSGFPEAFLATNDVEAQRWRRQYIDGLIRQDVLDFDDIRNVRAMQLVFELLRRRVGSTISYLSIAEDVGISPHTVSKYIQVLEALYVVFRITPYSKNIARSIIKEPKIYFFDTGLVIGDSGCKFENFVANSLLKHVYGQIDYLGQEWALHYLRTKEQHEVDFALVKDGNVETIIEAKNANKNLSPSLLYFHQKYQMPAIQLVKSLRQERVVRDIQILRAQSYLEKLYL